MAKHLDIMGILHIFAVRAQPIVGGELKIEYNESPVVDPSIYKVLRHIPETGWIFKTPAKTDSILVMPDPEHLGPNALKYFEVRVLCDSRLISLAEQAAKAMASLLNTKKDNFAVRGYGAGQV